VPTCIRVYVLQTCIYPYHFRALLAPIGYWDASTAPSPSSQDSPQFITVLRDLLTPPVAEILLYPGHSNPQIPPSWTPSLLSQDRNLIFPPPHPQHVQSLVQLHLSLEHRNTKHRCSNRKHPLQVHVSFPFRWNKRERSGLESFSRFVAFPSPRTRSDVNLQRNRPQYRASTTRKSGTCALPDSRRGSEGKASF
jgi:hypothetical protein